MDTGWRKMNRPPLTLPSPLMGEEKGEGERRLKPACPSHIACYGRRAATILASKASLPRSIPKGLVRGFATTILPFTRSTFHVPRYTLTLLLLVFLAGPLMGASADKLYLRDNTDLGGSEVGPAIEPMPNSNAGTEINGNDWAGSGCSQMTIDAGNSKFENLGNITLADNEPDYHACGRWISEVLAEQTFDASYLWTVRAAWKESNAAQNLYARACIYLWDGDADQFKGWIVEPMSYGSEMSQDFTDYTPINGVEGSTITAAVGDRIVVELRIEQIGSSNTGNDAYWCVNSPSTEGYGEAYLACSKAIIFGPPYISSLSPSQGPEGTTVEINGFNFGSDPGDGNRATAANHVTFSSGAITVPDSDFISWTTSKITLKVPVGAVTGDVQVTVDSIDGNKKPFIVTPKVTSITPDTVSQNTTSFDITVTGRTFRSDDIVTIRRAGTPVSGIPNPVPSTYVSDTELTATITIDYNVAAGTSTLRVERNGASSEYGEYDWLNINDYPTSKPTLPEPNSIKNSVPWIKGTATSPGIAFATPGVKVQIKRGADYWDGSAWGTTETWLDCVKDGTSWENWKYDSSGVTWTTDEYEIKSKAFNSRNGEEYEPDITGITFYYDDVPPTTSNTQPLDGKWHKITFDFTGTSDDNSGAWGFAMDTVTVSIYNEILLQYWDGSTWVDPPAEGQVWNVATGTSPWSYTLPSAEWTHNTRYRVVARALDKAGNWSEVYSTSTFTYDLYQAGPPEEPDSVVTVPPDNSYRTIDQLNTTDISGTAKENTQGGIYPVSYTHLTLPTN